MKINWSKLLPYSHGSQVAEACKRLLSELFEGKIVQAEFDKELNYVPIAYSEVLLDMRFKIGTSPPQCVDELRQKKADDQKFDSSKLMKLHPEINEWMDQEQLIANQNKVNAEELERLYTYFQSLGDVTSASKIREVYSEYPRSIYCGNSCIWIKRLP